MKLNTRLNVKIAMNYHFSKKEKINFWVFFFKSRFYLFSTYVRSLHFYQARQGEKISIYVRFWRQKHIVIHEILWKMTAFRMIKRRGKTCFQSKLIRHKLFLWFVHLRSTKNGKPFYAQLNNEIFMNRVKKKVFVAKGENKAISEIGDGEICVKQHKTDHTISFMIFC